MSGGLIAADKPGPTEIQGKATPVVTEEHFQVEQAPPPRLLPAQIREDKPTTPMLPTVRQAGGNVVGVQIPGVETPDLDIPIRASIGYGVPPMYVDKGIAAWKARAAFEVAEMHFRSCDAAEARLWYREVVKLAPGSDYGIMAKERLLQTDVVPAGAVESREPPLADAPPVGNVVRIR
ncbi:MAG TPA: hypothetical protein VHR66_03375 [Gemmataceae bacterium]|jgi:hypothetical protein|nr:hypothetical protein [Gemmataceae bacterium]